jgi:hypothetical protein
MGKVSVDGNIAAGQGFFQGLHVRWCQTLHCYTPANFLLLVEGTGLALKRVEVDRLALDWQSDAITSSGPLLDAWEYLV